MLNDELEVLQEKYFEDDFVTASDFKAGVLLISLLNGKIEAYRLQ
jgi:hypothetical protein